MRLNISNIQSNPNNARKYFDRGYLEQLGNDIEKNGLIQPIIVKRAGAKYEVVVGECRYRACRLRKLTTIEAIVDETLTPEQAREISFRENLHRKDISAVEEALYFQEEVTRGVTQQQIAEKFVISQSYVAQALGLLKCSRSVQDLIITRVISSKHGRELLRIQNLAEQYPDVWLNQYWFFGTKDVADTGYSLTALTHLADHVASRIRPMNISVGHLKELVDGLKFDIIRCLWCDEVDFSNDMEHRLRHGIFLKHKQSYDISLGDMEFFCKYAQQHNLWGDEFQGVEA